LLGEVVIALTPLPKGAHQFQVTFALDADGIFTGEVLHINENKATPIILDRGQGAMTEMKRIALAQQVETGVVSAEMEAAKSAPAANPTDQLVAEAVARLPSLRADKQRELAELLGQLQQARVANDARNVSLLVAQLTLLLVRLRT
jgi:hypothetical protein